MSERIFVLCGVVLVAGCFGQPGTRAEDELGDVDHEPTGDEHRPGQPCLVCHGSEYTPGGDVFEVAGTIYETPDSLVGLEGASILLRDADNRVVILESNRAGNFYLEEDDGGLRFPLHVTVAFEGSGVQMRSPIPREGSCAHCHTKDGPNEASVGRIYIREAP